MSLPNAATPKRSTQTLVIWVTIGWFIFAGFLALGIFQIKRLAWKQALLERVDQHTKAAPIKPPGPSQWPMVLRETHEYKRLEVSGLFRHDLAVRVRASTVLGAGYWVLTPLLTNDGYWLLVNRGFIPLDMKFSLKNSHVLASDQANITGLLRLTEPNGTWLQSNAPGSNRWYSRDVSAIAAHQGLQGAVAPFFLDATANTAQDRAAWPRAGLTVLRFNNNHLLYAVTWFALAAMTLVAITYLLVIGRNDPD